MPRLKNIDTAEQKVGQDSVRVMKSTGPAAEALSDATVEVVERPVNAEKMAMLAFDQEWVTVRISPSNDPIQKFPVSVNGQAEWLDGAKPMRAAQMWMERGKTYTIKRYLVEKLARAKHTGYSLAERKGEDGMAQYSYPSATALAFDFQVLRDENPRGASWLQHILLEP